jgi:hypothetical protein
MLPIDTNTAISILNLNSDDRIIATFDQHAQKVVLLLKRITDEDIWNDLQADLADEDTQNSFKFAYSYYLLVSAVEFLNLKTLGEGIIKSTGIDQQSTELLTGSEIKAFKKNLEIQALELISEYLNEAGFDRLKELKTGKSKINQTGIKIAVI